MLDLYSDFTQLSARSGIHVEILEMCDLAARLEQVTEAERAEKLGEIREMFEIGGADSADPRVRAPREDELLWGFFRWRRDDDATRQFQIWPLFRRERDGGAAPDASTDWSLACGLVGRETDPGTGERLTRLLWFLRF